jgi:hypothetical protein
MVISDGMRLSGKTPTRWDNQTGVKVGMYQDECKFLSSRESQKDHISKKSAHRSERPERHSQVGLQVTSSECSEPKIGVFSGWHVEQQRS